MNFMDQPSINSTSSSMKALRPLGCYSQDSNTYNHKNLDSGRTINKDTSRTGRKSAVLVGPEESDDLLLISRSV